MDLHRFVPGWAALATALAVLVGAALAAHSALQSAATYDEVAYIEVAADWWRTGRQERISRMGSPLVFWKLQQAPTLALIDRLGFGPLIDDPLRHQAILLPVLRCGALWIWAAALLLTAAWANWAYGPRAGAFAAWWFALSPNLLAHGALVTMELPLVATSTTTFFLFARFLDSGRAAPFYAAAACAGVAFSCKFTAVLLPILFAIAWWWHLWRTGPTPIVPLSFRVLRGMIAFGLVMVLADLLVTGGAMLPLSENQGAHPSLPAWAARLAERPLPQDWVGFAKQLHHQRGGGPGYLLGERRSYGWWYYYFVCLAVKAPLGLGLVLLARACLGRPARTGPTGHLCLVAVLATLVIVAVGSNRNYGFRYLLFLAPLAIVWISALAEGCPWARAVAAAGLVAQAVAVASCHPHELTYFNRLVGGPEGGKLVLADSNLDWGQGARALARLQLRHPEFRDLTAFLFADTEPAAYGVVGRCFRIDAHGPREPLPELDRLDTPYLAVSRSLQYGPWGPNGYFEPLRDKPPVAITDDHTIAVYGWPARRPRPSQRAD